MKLLRTLLLVLTLSGSAYAGNIQNGVVQPPPPNTVTAETTEPSELTEETTEQTSTVTELILTVVRVLGLF